MPNRYPIVALVTDFGLRDHYVGVMKAVMLSICPSLRIVDITNDVEPRNVRQGAYFLWASYRQFPKGTIFACVVDPGVGSARDIIIADTRRHLFVSPGNGLLDLVLWEERLDSVTLFRHDNPKTKSILPKEISRTFHGRDIIGPLAAHLAHGIRVRALGTKGPVDWLKPPFVDERNPTTNPVVLNIDRFGNIITNVACKNQKLRRQIRGIEAGSRIITRWIENYESAPEDEPCLIEGCSGLVEIVMKNRSAAQFLSADQALSLTILRS